MNFVCITWAWIKIEINNKIQAKLNENAFRIRQINRQMLKCPGCDRISCAISSTQHYPAPPLKMQQEIQPNIEIVASSPNPCDQMFPCCLGIMPILKCIRIHSDCASLSPSRGIKFQLYNERSCGYTSSWNPQNAMYDKTSLNLVFDI